MRGPTQSDWMDVERFNEEIAISGGLCYHCTLEDGGKYCINMLFATEK